jgi:type II restriction enzyme
MYLRLEQALMSFRRHLTCAEDLITLPADTQAGFVALALERNRRAQPHIDDARALRVAASQYQQPIQLFAANSIQAALLTAAGVSNKAATHFDTVSKQNVIQQLISDFLEPAGSTFVEELVYRFLLTRGDTLGGTLRNVGGLLAQQKFARTILAVLRNAGVPFVWLHGATTSWAAAERMIPGIEHELKGLSWSVGQQNYTLLFNIKVPQIRKSIDLVLLNIEARSYTRAVLAEADRYRVLGELKGGIDPAGADEHWKTASKALERIRRGFANATTKPAICFVGAAIAQEMAREIWDDLRAEQLTNAANLNNDGQLVSLCRWLCGLG